MERERRPAVERWSVSYPSHRNVSWA